MKDLTQLTEVQAQHIADLQARVDIIEHGVIHAAMPHITELNDAATSDNLTIERLCTAVDKFNSLLDCLYKEQKELDSIFDYYIKKNAESEGNKHDNHE